MVNKVILVGNLGSDPEFRQLESGSRVVRFSVATNESYKDKTGQWVQNTEWHTVVAWGYTADYVNNNINKGAQVFVEGKLTHRKWQDKDGQNRYSTEVEAQSVKLLDKNTERNSDQSQTGNEGFGGNKPTSNTNDDLPF